MTGSSFSSKSTSSRRSSSASRKGVGSSFGSGKVDTASSGGGGGIKVPGLTLVGKALQFLDQGRRGVTAVVKELDDALPGTKADRAKSDGFHLSDIPKNYRADIGAGDLVDTGNEWVDRALGLAGDIALDPLSYVTLGVGSAAKKGVQGSARLAGRRTAVEVAREAAEAGDKELANRILGRGIRGSTNVMKAEEAAAYGIRQGPTIGIGKARAALPGGDKVARAASTALSPLTDAANKLPLHGIGNALKGATPLERQLARDADRSRRLAAKGANQAAKRELSGILKAHPDLDQDLLRDALEGTAAHPAAGQAREILDTYHSWAEQQLGRDLPYYDDYLTHRLTPEAKAARDAAGIPSPMRRGGKPGILKERGYKPGDTFYGEVLQDGSITEMNRIYKAKVGAKHSLYEENPVKLIHQWIDDITTMVSRSPDSFATAAGAKDATLKAVAAPGAKAAAKEARSIDKALKRAADELEATRSKIGTASSKAAEADTAAKTAVGDANRVAQGGNPMIEKAAADYAANNGLAPPTPVDRGLKVNDSFATRIAHAYNQLPVLDEAARPSYEAFAAEVDKQYAYLTRQLGIKVEFVGTDPYKSAQEMMADVLKNRRLKVWSTPIDDAHPFLTTDQNNRFRAVHDFFGHAQAGNKFDRHGEEIAYRLHSQMFSDTARPAMATETRGQNSFLNYHPDNVARKAAGQRAEFPPQKAALLDNEFVTSTPARGGSSLATPETQAGGLLAGLPDLDTKLGALKAAAGRDTTVATPELLELTGAKPTGEMLQGEREFLMPDGHKVPERNILAHASANVQLEDLKARHAAARADVAAKLRPQVVEQAKTLDHITVATDPEAILTEASDNLKSLDALRVLRHKAKEAELAFREEADRLYTEAAAQRAAGDIELANVAALEAQARKMEADLPDLDRKFEKAMKMAGQEKMVRDLDAMARQGLVELADGRYAEPWVADAAQRIHEAMTPAKVGRLIKEFDRVSGYWRASALLSPGFHGRNSFGAMFNNMLAGMDWGRYTQFHVARKQFEAGGLKAVKDPAVRKAIEAAQKVGQWEGADISEVSKLAGMKEGGRIIGRQNWLFRKNFAFGTKVEQYARMPLFIDTYIKTAGDEVAALDAVMKYHFDYDDLSRTEREVGRRAFGFYTWSRNNMPLMLAEMADKPGVFNRYTHLKRNMELGVDPDEGKPSYFNKALAIALPFKFAGGRVYAFPDLPFISASNNLGVNELASGLNPLIKLPLETFTNTKFFEQRQFSPTLRATPAVWKPILMVLANVPHIPGLPRVQKAKDGTLMMDEREANKIESLLPMLARMRRLAPSEQKYQDRVLTSWLSFVGGVSARTLDDATIGGEMQRRKSAAQAAAKRKATLQGGKALDDFKAAERQAKAIKAAIQARESGTRRVGR